MTSKELVQKTIRGENDTGLTPLYGWVRENMQDKIAGRFGSVEAFEDHYQFDMAHLFGAPAMYDEAVLNNLRESEGEITPEMLLDIPMLSPDDEAAYSEVKRQLQHYSVERERFCYIQSNGIFELNNEFFGIENHLCNLLLYPDELHELYARQAQWNAHVASNMLDLGVDMIHVSDDWGAQKSLMFSPELLREFIIPNHRPTAELVHQRGAFLSLHSDGCIVDALDDIVSLGYNVLHPWQESAGMSYDLYLSKYAERFAILGGMCVQSTLGFGDLPRLEREMRRVCDLMRGKRFILCTTHWVQDHCSIDELVFAFDLALQLCGKK